MLNVEELKTFCTGCAACLNICGQNAILMKEDKSGFRYPEIDIDKCVHCMECAKVCEKRNCIPEDILETPQIYAMRSRDDTLRFHSTSGGIFSELANIVLREKGSVVGAAYKADWSVEHCIIHDISELEGLRRSKYQQSHINYIYREVETVLKQHQTVLFCGTPCQVGGLKAFLVKPYDNLFTCDFICRGVTSPKIFLQYINYLKKVYNSEIDDIWMKNKSNGWHELTTVISFENGEKYIKRGLDDSYVQLYLKYNAGVRNSCYACQFKNKKDVADLTLGDFWGLEGSELDDNLGTSVVICRTRRGMQLIKKIKSKVYYKKKTLNDVRKGNPCLTGSIDKSLLDMDVFFDIMENKGYEETMKWVGIKIDE